MDFRNSRRGATVLALGAVLTLGACAGTRNYQPAVERPFAQVASEGCGRSGDMVIVQGLVSRAYENRVVLADYQDPGRVITVDVPGRGRIGSQARRLVGTSRHELTAQTLNELSERGTPVTVTMECKGGRVAPVATNFEYVNQDGSRVAIAY